MLMGQYEIDYARRKVEEYRNKSELQEFELKQYLRAQDTSVDRRKCPCCGILSSVEYDNCVKCGKYLGNENIVTGELYAKASFDENVRTIHVETYGVLFEDIKERSRKPEPKPEPVVTAQPVQRKPGEILIPYKPVPRTTSTDRAENIRVIEEQNKMYMSDQNYRGFLDNLFWMVPAFFGSYLLNGSWMIRAALIIYFIYGCYRMMVAEVRWK